MKMNKNCDGHVRNVDSSDLTPGTVVRMTQSEEGSLSPFSDCLILKVSPVPGTNDSEVTLARPYSYVSGADTACPTILMGYETFKVTNFRLMYGPFKTVLKAHSNEPFAFVS
jgi:hypothetical protein